MKKFAKLNEFEFYSVCSKEPTDLCKQENDINMLALRR